MDINRSQIYSNVSHTDLFNNTMYEVVLNSWVQQICIS